MDTKLLISPPYKRMFLCSLHLLMTVGMLFALTSCRTQASSAPPVPMLREGEELNGMTITTGSEGAIPLEIFCNFDMGEEVTETIDCQVPALPELAIGHMIGVTGWTQQQDPANLDWDVYLDGYLLDLDTFQDQTDIDPAFLSAPAAIREVSMQRNAWDIVLIDPTFGMHTLRTTVQDHSVIYDRVVNFMINSNSSLLAMGK